MIVSAGRDRLVHIFDVYAFKRLNTLRGHTASITAAKFLAGGLATASWDKEILVWSFDEVRSDFLPIVSR
jgi:WD40 repeat protein